MIYGAIYPSLKGRTVLVTGGGGGIGESITRHFAAQGSKVGFIDINREVSEKLVADLRGKGQTVHFAHADLTDIAALKSAITEIRAALGPITILVNNAAHDQRHTIAEVTPDYFDDRIAVNLKHQFFCIQAVADDMKAAGNGAIINMGSTSWMMATPNLSVYETAKAGVLGLTRGVSRELGPFNIRVNSIAPGWIMTERQKTLWLTPEGAKARDEGQALKRPLEPDDMARVVLFFASDEAGACTNQCYIADGGWY